VFLVFLLDAVLLPFADAFLFPVLLVVPDLLREFDVLLVPADLVPVVFLPVLFAEVLRFPLLLDAAIK
jgi:hypothetical protein